MELPHIGKTCTEESCKKLDFLPFTCDACQEIFCEEHYSYTTHNCPKAYLKNNQVPVCPLCNIPIPISRGQLPDVAVGAHIDNDCQSDPAKNRRKVFTNKCSRKGCKNKEFIPVVCNDCTYNFCLKHRHPTDHNCEGKLGATRKKAVDAALNRQKQSTTCRSASLEVSRNMYSAQVQGNITEDEALARALALSMEVTSAANTANLTQEQLDLALARQLASESETVDSGTRNRRVRCNLQ